MIEPRERRPERRTEVATPEVRPEVTSDLDLTDADADDIAGGCIGGIRLALSHLA